MGGDNIPNRPPVWACHNGCKRFRKVNADGTDAPVKVKQLSQMRQAPATVFNWQSSAITKALEAGERPRHHVYLVDICTDLDERETFKCTALSAEDAAETIRDVVACGRSGLVGRTCEVLGVRELT